MLIKAAINGGRTRAEHPAVPQTPEELAAASRESVAAGAGAVHFHVRSHDGRESLDPDDVARAVEAVRAAIPSTPFGISTGAWIVPDVERRHQMLARWTVLPDFASVNFHEAGATALAELLFSRGVGLEASASTVHGAEVFAASGLAGRCLRILLEPQEQATDEAQRNVAAMEAVLDRAGIKVPRLLHGHGANDTAWQILDVAIAKGYDTRIGFEDVLTLPDGSQAVGNGALVAEARRRARR